MKKKFILPSPEEAKQLRILTGLKTQDLKDKCPVDIGHVYRLEKGQNVSYDKVKQIIEFYNKHL